MRAEDDLHAWLNAAVGNQDICIEVFNGTDGRLLRRVEAAVAQLTQLVSNLLAMHKCLRSLTPIMHEPDNRNCTDGLAPWVMDIEGVDREEGVDRTTRAGGGREGCRRDGEWR